MRRLHIREYTQDDLRYFPIQPTITLLLPVFGKTYVACDGEILVAIGGVIMPYPGVGEAWLCLNPAVDISGYIFPLYRALREMLDYLIQKTNVWRLQATVDGTAKSRRLVEHLRFKLEGSMRLMGPQKETYFRYVKLIEE